MNRANAILNAMNMLPVPAALFNDIPVQFTLPDGRIESVLVSQFVLPGNSAIPCEPAELGFNIFNPEAYCQTAGEFSARHYLDEVKRNTTPYVSTRPSKAIPIVPPSPDVGPKKKKGARNKNVKTEQKNYTTKNQSKKKDNPKYDRIKPIESPEYAEPVGRTAETNKRDVENSPYELTLTQVIEFCKKIKQASHLLERELRVSQASQTSVAIDDILTSEKTLVTFRRKARLFAPYVRTCSVCNLIEQSMCRHGYSDLYKFHLGSGDSASTDVTLKDVQASENWCIKLSQFRYMHRLKPMFNHQAFPKIEEVRQHACIILKVCDIVISENVLGRLKVLPVRQKKIITGIEASHGIGLTKDRVLINIPKSTVNLVPQKQIAKQTHKPATTKTARKEKQKQRQTVPVVTKRSAKNPKPLVQCCVEKVRKHTISLHLFSDKRVNRVFRRANRMGCPKGRKQFSANGIENTLWSLLMHDGNKPKPTRKMHTLKRCCEEAVTSTFRTNIGQLTNQIIHAALDISSYQLNRNSAVLARNDRIPGVMKTRSKGRKDGLVPNMYSMLKPVIQQTNIDKKSAMSDAKLRRR